MEIKQIHPNVKLGANVRIGKFCIIGEPPRGMESGELETVIGDNTIIRSHTVIYAGNIIGNNLQTGHHVFIREMNEIGDNVSIGTGADVEHHTIIENNVRVHSHAAVPEYSHLKEEAWIGPYVNFINCWHPGCPKAKECIKGPTIGRHAKLGANVLIYPRINIGDYAFIGAGAIVRKDVPSRAVIVGDKNRIVGDVFELTCPYGLIDKPYQEKDFN
ncbi:Transferase [Candidatus Magnetomoraceae bacterium gMMP-1]